MELAERFGGKVPDNLEDLLSLPGVGRKTANIVLGNAFGQRTIGVDTHVMRLSQRLGFTKQTDPDKVEFDLMPLVPERQRVHFCHLLHTTVGACAWRKFPAAPTARFVGFVPILIKRHVQIRRNDNFLSGTRFAIPFAPFTGDNARISWLYL
jgi:endonuclease-3